MTAMDDDIGACGDIAVAAMQVQAHNDGRRCAGCETAGCVELARAEAKLAEHRRKRASRPGSR